MANPVRTATPWLLDVPSDHNSSSVSPQVNEMLLLDEKFLACESLIFTSVSLLFFFFSSTLLAKKARTRTIAKMALYPSHKLVSHDWVNVEVLQ